MGQQQVNQWLRKTFAVGALVALTALPAVADQAPSAAGPAPAAVLVQISGPESAGAQHMITAESSLRHAPESAVPAAKSSAQASSSAVLVYSRITGAESAGPQLVAVKPR